MRPRSAVVLVAWLVTAGCARTEASADGAAVTPGEGAGDDASADADTDSAASTVGDEAVTVSKELPAELHAELRLTGDNADGRLVTLAPGFIATAACSDCGAPSYLWFLAVRCVDPKHCQVLTEACEGDIAREVDGYHLEFRPVEGGPGDAAETCAGYTGVFEAP